jgi:hypothetical protein
MIFISRNPLVRFFAILYIIYSHYKVIFTMLNLISLLEEYSVLSYPSLSAYFN